MLKAEAASYSNIHPSMRAFCSLAHDALRPLVSIFPKVRLYAKKADAQNSQLIL